MELLREFREFAMKGNVLDLAVGVIIGGAFGKIITSLVNDIIMPILGLLTGGIDFTGLKLAIGSPESELAINYGMFLQSAVDFLIIAISIFMFIKAINSFRKKDEVEEEVPAEVSKEEVLLEDIKDILKEKL
ncbi:MAG: large-conductance mechanosensitive channel protein MscL [Clostridia bacterium]|nr:large-conductance mechanosensitive channel protein MscL [Clostridia bacterium]